MSIGAWIGCVLGVAGVFAVAVAFFGQFPERTETPEEREARLDAAEDALERAFGLVSPREVLGGGESVSTQIQYSNAQRWRALVEMEQGMQVYDYRNN